MQHAHRVHDHVGVELGVLVVGVFVADAEVERLGLAFREMKTRTAFQDEEAAVGLGLGAGAVGARFLGGRDDGLAGRAFGESIVALHEAARAADHEQAHYLAPIVGMRTLLESGEAIQRALVLACELLGAAIAIAAQVFLGPDADDILGFEEKAKLIAEVEIVLVVGRGRKEDTLASVPRNVVADDGPTAALAVSQVVAFVNDDDAEAAEFGQDVLRLGDRDNFGKQAVAVGVVLPHADEILRAEDECLEGARRVLEDTSQRGGHQCFAKSNDIAKDDTPALFQMPCRDANRCGLKFEQGIAHVLRDGKFGQARARFLSQVVGHLDVNLIRRRALGPSPAFVDDLDEFLGDVDAPLVVPAVVEPLFQFLRGIMVEDIHIEFALFGKTGEREVAGAEKAGDRIIRVSAEAQVELCMERVPEMELHDDLARLELRGQSAQARLVVVGRSANRELRAELLGQPSLQANDGLIADLLFLRQETVGFAEFVLRQSLHPDQQAALLPRSARPFFNQCINGFPAAQIEVADAEI